MGWKYIFRKLFDIKKSQFICFIWFLICYCSCIECSLIQKLYIYQVSFSSVRSCHELEIFLVDSYSYFFLCFSYYCIND